MTPLQGARADDVWELLSSNARAGGTVELSVEEALGMVVARGARCEIDYPPFDRALMDGYAVRTTDLCAANATLENAGLAQAGAATSAVEMRSGQCVRINTGAEIPRGADAVVAVEEVEERAGGQVRFEHCPKPGENIERRGAVVGRGGLLVRAGSRVGPGAFAALVSGGVKSLLVYQRARVAILSTGDELAPAGAQISAGQIYDSNSLMLRELVSQCGAEVVDEQRCLDEDEQLRAALHAGLKADLLCVTGGMSMGTHDLVPGLLEELGVEWLVTSLNLKPGKPMRLGRAPQGGWVLGLPGNPVSCSVCFLLFGRPLLDALHGMPFAAPRRMQGRLQAGMPANGARPMFQPAEWAVADDGGASVTPQAWRGSGDPFGMAGANALIARPERAPAVGAGDSVMFIPLDGPA